MLAMNCSASRASTCSRRDAVKESTAPALATREHLLLGRLARLLRLGAQDLELGHQRLHRLCACLPHLLLGRLDGRELAARLGVRLSLPRRLLAQLLLAPRRVILSVKDWVVTCS